MTLCWGQAIYTWDTTCAWGKLLVVMWMRRVTLKHPFIVVWS